jgi:hypothetical protein
VREMKKLAYDRWRTCVIVEDKDNVERGPI